MLLVENHELRYPWPGYCTMNSRNCEIVGIPNNTKYYTTHNPIRFQKYWKFNKNIHKNRRESNEEWRNMIHFII